MIFGKLKDKINIQSCLVGHGKEICNCFIFNKRLAYISDVNFFYKKSEKYFYNLKYLILDCLRYKYHPSHFNLEEALQIVSKYKPRKTILTNLHSDMDYEDLKKKLPKNIVPAYDGLRLNLFNFFNFGSNLIR